MTKTKLHNDCKVLSGYVYKTKKPDVINDWKYTNSCQGSNGFYAEIYKKNSDIMKALPKQIENAREVYNDYAKAYPDKNIILTGHSLGGSLAQALGAETGAETVTFNAYGIASTHSPTFKYTDNITNYGNAQDGVFVSNIDFQLGKTVILNTDAKPGDSFGTGMHKFNINPHYIENLGDLSKGVEYKREVFENEKAPLFKIGVEYNNYEPDKVFDVSNRVLYKGEVNPFQLDTKDPVYDLYLDQMIDKKPMPTKKELDKRTRIGELIYVDEYVRSDGTKVSGYYRAYPR